MYTQKIIFSSIVTGYFGGRCAGLYGAAAGYALPIAFYSYSESDRSWFHFNPKQQIKYLIKTICAFGLTKKIVAEAIIMTLIFARQINNAHDLKGQTDHQKIIEKFSKSALYFYFGLFGPVTEEILFRGFIMDVLRSLLPKNGTKAARIALQGLLFGALHYRASQSLSNYLIVADSALFGMACGYLMEETSNIALPILFHSCSNLLALTFRD